MKSQNPTFGNLRFSEIPAEAQRQFLNYEFSVVILEDAGDRVVLDIFARLNTYAQKLRPGTPKCGLLRPVQTDRI
jgi:hypothetical protein